MNVVWTPALVFFASGLGLLLVGGAALAFLLVQRGRTRAKTPGEIADRMHRFNDVLEPQGVAYGRGVRREASIGIDDLRKLAQRGEWAVFWACPFTFFGFGFGILGIVAAASAYFGEAVFAIAAATVCVPVGLFGWFAAWAALYTNIDSKADDA